MSSYPKEMVTDRHETPVFYETLGAAADTTPASAELNFHEVDEMTDLHKVETFLELTARAA
jgi:hypothetical protein